LLSTATVLVSYSYVRFKNVLQPLPQPPLLLLLLNYHFSLTLLPPASVVSYGWGKDQLYLLPPLSETSPRRNLQRRRRRRRSEEDEEEKEEE